MPSHPITSDYLSQGGEIRYTIDGGNLTGWRSVAASAYTNLLKTNDRARSGQLQRRVGRAI